MRNNWDVGKLANETIDRQSSGETLSKPDPCRNRAAPNKERATVLTPKQPKGQILAVVFGVILAVGAGRAGTHTASASAAPAPATPASAATAATATPATPTTPTSPPTPPTPTPTTTTTTTAAAFVARKAKA